MFLPPCEETRGRTDGDEFIVELLNDIAHFDVLPFLLDELVVDKDRRSSIVHLGVTAVPRLNKRETRMTPGET